MWILMLAASCGNKHGSAPASAHRDISPAARARFASECVSCHGADGKGNNPVAAALNPKPRDYTDKVWQDSVTDDRIKDVIIRGGAAVLGAGHEASAMPAHDDLKDQPDLVNGLVGIIREFRGK
jgi:cytochrome c553